MLNNVVKAKQYINDVYIKEYKIRLQRKKLKLTQSSRLVNVCAWFTRKLQRFLTAI